jgi:hypothetical protein
MSHEMTPPGETINEMKRKENAFRLLMEIAVSPEREPSKAEVCELMWPLSPILRHRFGCWLSIWTPEDIQDYAADLEGQDLRLDYDRAKQVCKDLDTYDYIYSEINDAIRNELVTLRNSGYGET